MGATDSKTKQVDVAVENVGGIDTTDVSFSAGVTILTGRNATNRTSLLQAIMAGLGSDNVSLKGDADEGRVELTVGDETYTRTLTRQSGTVVTNGDPYLDEAEIADLFVFLLESNEARRAVERTENLRELIMRPVDTAAIESEIDQLQGERDDIEQRLDDLKSLRTTLPELEERRQSLEREIEDKREELAEKKEQIDDADQDVGTTRDQKAELEDALESFREARSDLEDVRYNLDSERESIDALESEIEEVETELDELPAEVSGDVNEVEDRIDRLREQRQTLDSTVNELQKVIQFNEEMLEGTSSDVVAALRGEDDAEELTERLVDDQVVCWTCGSEVDQSDVETTLDRIRDLRQSKLSERQDLQSEIDDLKTEKATYQEQQRQRSQLDDRRRRAESELTQRRERVDALEAERDRLEERIDDLEGEVNDLQDETQSDLLDLHREANELEFEISRRQDDLEDVSEEIERIESELDRRDDLKAEREELQDRIEDLRTRIDRIETEAVEQFNEHMESVLEMLGYENLERIWIERKQERVKEGRRRVEKSVFDLHVVRSTEDGTTYEDSIDHLSESEREVTGLIFALAGYLTHDVYETCPFLLLDSIEAIDSDRIARLVDYVSEYAEYVVVALLEEDAQALDDSYQRVTEV
ncbi:Chromosome segregation protein (Spc25, Csm1, Pcs1) [Halosimplex carlsbadense 2-9-1]|uniref:Chromosome segregation protein (Spc25, Csm1, Pcs1) n=1 Tax=Halosimplex carlsbadense 2-9-1 TaxID=797114 RepID=M0CYR7_9EURY|nr:archaea-specific SMC-related protein [Halosimplex carlsbadense]ELZ27009.1 Chromosome segregation protein (Spc25, Csm1, Pcs1) [Halosimplex carlsbadense 2-9-1]